MHQAEQYRIVGFPDGAADALRRPPDVMINAGSGIRGAAWDRGWRGAATDLAHAHPPKLNLLFSHTYS